MLIDTHYPSLKWISEFVAIFIFLSIRWAWLVLDALCLSSCSVSFLSMGTGLKVQLDGYAVSHSPSFSPGLSVHRVTPTV